MDRTADEQGGASALNPSQAISSAAECPAGGLFRFLTLSLSYEPFPVGIVQDVFEPGYYARLLGAWPPLELFDFKPDLGKKYSLSEVNRPRDYYDYVRSHGDWLRLYEELKSEGFIRSILEALRERGVETGLERRRIARRENRGFWRRRWRRLVERLGWGRQDLSARFEFSMLPAEGGCIKPHTDSPQKHVTLVVCMMGPEEWNPEWGGETAILKPKDVRRNYNFMNRQLEFEEVEVLGGYPPHPNQGVVFIKTFNSLHAVFPMKAKGIGAMRKTLTINIEDRAL